MSAKIEVIGKWSADACLHSALEEIDPKHPVIIITMTDETRPRYWTANVNAAEGVFMLDVVKGKFLGWET